MRRAVLVPLASTTGGSNCTFNKRGGTMLRTYKCRKCGWWSYTLNAKEHDWFYAPAAGTPTDDFTYTLCPICRSPKPKGDEKCDYTCENAPSADE